jgi:hypothetical protein
MPEQISNHGLEVKIANEYCYAVVAMVHFED